MSEIHESDILAESEDFAIWRSKEEDVGYIYHLEFGNLTMHFGPEEWNDLVALIKEAG